MNDMIKRRIVSWDVGIKNLAYCVIEYACEDNEIKKKEDGGIDINIMDWDIVNLIETKTNKCDKCKNPATFIGDNSFLCGVHKKKYVPKYTDDIVVKLKDKHNCIKCGGSAYYKIVTDEDRFMCSSHKKSELNRIKKQCELKKINKRKANKTSIIELCKTMISKLDGIKSIHDVDEVLIENQPSMKNPMMKTISAFLASYFTIRCVNDSKRTELVKFMSPSNKLKINKDRTAEVISRNKDKEYKMTKQLAIEYSTTLIENTEWSEHLKKYKKKDDLCDALLQGYYYLSCRR